MSNTRLVNLEFHPATEPPDADTTVLCCDGEELFTGWYEGTESSGKQLWFDCLAKPVSVLSWAHLPDPQDCVREQSVPVWEERP